MKLKPVEIKLPKDQLCRLMLREAISRLVMDGEYKTYSSAYMSIKRFVLKGAK
jgi:hypothetical protein